MTLALLVAGVLLAQPLPAQRAPAVPGAAPDTTVADADSLSSATARTAPPPDSERASGPASLDAPRLPRAQPDSGAAPIELRPRLAPASLFSTSRGFGIAGGVGIRNLGFEGSDVVLDAYLAQRYQGARISAYTDPPYASNLYGFVSVGASTTTRRRFYGLGATSREENQLFLDYASMDAETRVGAYPLGNTGLFLQPGARLLWDRLSDVEEAELGALDRITEADRQAIVSVRDDSRYGVSLGLQVASDLRDWRAYPRKGTFVSVEARRFYALDGSDLRFNRFGFSSLGYLPIRGRTALIGRTNLVLTRSDGDAPIPFYYLPSLDSRLLTAYAPDRFVGRDVLAFVGGIRVPIADFIGVYGVDMALLGYMGNAYDNVFDQVKAGVSFDSERLRPDEDGRISFRPALGLGIGIVNLDKERVVVGGLIGVGPEGISLATLRVAYDLRDSRPLFR